jgi:hypothetical protein
MAGCRRRSSGRESIGGCREGARHRSWFCACSRFGCRAAADGAGSWPRWAGWRRGSVALARSGAGWARDLPPACTQRARGVRRWLRPEVGDDEERAGRMDRDQRPAEAGDLHILLQRRRCDVQRSWQSKGEDGVRQRRHESPPRARLESVGSVSRAAWHDHPSLLQVRCHRR